MRTVRHLAVALLTGLAVALALYSVTADLETRPVVVASHALRRGSRITMKDLAVREVPVNEALQGAFDSTSNLSGRIARIDIDSGMPLFANYVDVVPPVPQGSTVLNIALASAVDTLTTGDEMTLSATSACQDTSCENASTVLAERAVVMGKPVRDAGGAITTVPFAVDHLSATRILSAQEHSAIMAISRESTGSQ